jgi:hypothetical protein
MPYMLALQLVYFSLDPKLDSKCAGGASASGMIKDVVELKNLNMVTREMPIVNESHLPQK